MVLFLTRQIICGTRSWLGDLCVSGSVDPVFGESRKKPHKPLLPPLKIDTAAILLCLIDAAVIGGVVFFSSLSIAGPDIIASAKISLLSAFVTTGLNFFIGVRRCLLPDNHKRG